MVFELPKTGKAAIPLKHFPTAFQAFIFRAYEYIPPERIAEVLGTSEENVVSAAREMGLDCPVTDDVWLTKGYITIIRRMWHILPYDQLLQLLGVDDQTLAVTMREEDFLDIKLKEKPVCDRLSYRELTDAERARTAEIKKIMSTISQDGVKPFEFKYEMPKLKLSGKNVFDTRMIYSFCGLYQHAFDVDSEVYCPDEMLESYSRLGVNAIWTQGILFQLTEFPFEPEISAGYRQRQERLRKFTERCDKYGIKVFLYLNEPRSMPESFFERYPHIRGQEHSDDKISLCTSTKEVQDYLKDAVESVCRAAPKIGGFFTITRSENITNCYSHTTFGTCSCPRCGKRKVGDVISEVIGCFSEGAHRVSRDIKVMAWSWAWNTKNLEIISKLPKDVVLISQSELNVPFTIGGVSGDVVDYSMSRIGPGERAKTEWAEARRQGLKTAAKVQVGTTWECSTVPAIPVYDLIEEHIRAIRDEGVSDLILSWTLGGYPSRNILHAAKYFTESCETDAETDAVKEAATLFSEAFTEFPFHIRVVYSGPQNAGPANLLFDTPTGYNATMTCFAYDDIDKWRSIYPENVFLNQLEKLCDKWEKGVKRLENEPECEAKIMGEAAYCMFSASRNQVRFYIARKNGDREAMLSSARDELACAEKMLTLMNKNASIGFEAANHYYFSRGCICEKIINCHDIISRLS